MALLKLELEKSAFCMLYAQLKAKKALHAAINVAEQQGLAQYKEKLVDRLAFTAQEIVALKTQLYLRD